MTNYINKGTSIWGNRRIIIPFLFFKLIAIANLKALTYIIRFTIIIINDFQNGIAEKLEPAHKKYFSDS